MKRTKIKPLIGEDYQLQAHSIGDVSTISCRSCGHQLRKIVIVEMENVVAEIMYSLKHDRGIKFETDPEWHKWALPPETRTDAQLVGLTMAKTEEYIKDVSSAICKGLTGPSLSLPGIDPPKKRYSVPRTHVLRHKMTRAEQDVMVGEYKNKMLTPDKIIIKWDISPGQLYYILKKHHIDTIYKPKQKGLEI